MKSKIFTAITVSLLAALILPPLLTAQDQPAGHRSENEPARFILVDLGTFGGPTSFLDCCGGVPPVLNKRGTVVGGADSPSPNPNFANFNPLIGPDPNVDTGFTWQNGVLTNLGTLPGGYNSFANSINASGAIVGTSENGGTDPLLGIPECHPVLWKDRGVVDLGTLGGYEGLALAVNNHGLVVGIATNAVPDSFPGFPNGIPWGTQSRAFRWENGTIQDLGTLGGTDATSAFVNDHGQIAGMSYTNSTINPATGLPTQDPFLWDDGKLLDLGTLGGTFGFPNGINNHGEVVGQSNLVGDSNYHPFLWKRGLLIDLGTFGGDKGFASSVNDAGEIVGRADLSGNEIHHAFLWKHGTMTDLGIPPGGGPCSTAYSINSKGQVVGDSGICNVGGPPFLWEHGVIYNLNDLVLPGSDLTLVDVDTINDRGEIACTSVLADGNPHACVLVPLDLAQTEGLTTSNKDNTTPVRQSATTQQRILKRFGRP
jgi:probable HAF family extracellular repeat protein